MYLGASFPLYLEPVGSTLGRRRSVDRVGVLSRLQATSAVRPYVSDVIERLRAVPWRLHAQYYGGEAASQEQVSALLNDLQDIEDNVGDES